MLRGAPSKIAGYQVSAVLGRGGAGTVYAATSAFGPVAIKTLHASVRSAPMSERFLREAAIIAQLRSRHTVRVFEWGFTDDGTAFIVMERLEGCDLEQRLTQGRPAPATAVAWVLQMCAAMDEAHSRGLVHRDLKPKNVFLAKPSDTVRVLDFGIARVATSSGLTSAETLLGTPRYIAPEVLLGEPARPSADIYAMGVIAYRCLAGRHPFIEDHEGGPTPLMAILYATVHSTPASLAELCHDAPPELVDVVMRALARDPRDRFPSARAFADALAPFGGPVDAPEALPSAPPVACELDADNFRKG